MSHWVVQIQKWWFWNFGSQISRLQSWISLNWKVFILFITDMQATMPGSAWRKLLSWRCLNVKTTFFMLYWMNFGWNLCVCVGITKLKHIPKKSMQKAEPVWDWTCVRLNLGETEPVRIRTFGQSQMFWTKLDVYMFCFCVHKILLVSVN